MIKHCIGCGELIHPKRIEIIPNTKTCVSCSTTGAKRGVPVLHGNVEKDDTWVDMVFFEADDFEKFKEQDKKLQNIVATSTKAEYQDYEEEDTEIEINDLKE
jgi:hypothetical protein